MCIDYMYVVEGMEVHGRLPACQAICRTTKRRSSRKKRWFGMPCDVPVERRHGPNPDAKPYKPPDYRPEAAVRADTNTKAESIALGFSRVQTETGPK